MMRALILAPFDDTEISRLRKTIPVQYKSWFQTRCLWDPTDLANTLNDHGINILIIESDFVFEEVFEEAPNLEFVGICRGSISHIDIDSATKHNVLVVNTPGRNAQAVAEHILGLMLSLARKISVSHAYIKEGFWLNPAEPYLNMRGVELAGRTLGILGLGSIGHKLAEIGTALSMRVLAYDPYVTSPPSNVSLMDLETLVAQSDFVSVNVPGSQSTQSLVNEYILSLMKPTAYLISASDPIVIDQLAVVEALQTKKIAGAAFDVFETHPVSPHDPILSADNVILTPHIGGATGETITRHSQMMTKDILRFHCGKRPVHLINSDTWEHYV